MRRQATILTAFLALVLGATSPSRGEQDTLPPPRRLHVDEDWNYSPSDFDRIMAKLKAERQALATDWQALQKRNTAPQTTVDAEQQLFKMHLQKALQRLQQKGPPSGFRSGPGAARKKPEGEADPKKQDENPKSPAETSPGAVDSLSQAQALMRTKHFEDALASFQLVNLKGKKAEERAPVQYLKACCLLQLGKTKDATDLLQEVANSRGDEILAGYAQWELEMLRWHRDVEQRLQDVRQRLQAVEKR